MNTTSTSRADVVIVGGGLIGLASAYRLASRGADVVVLDQHAPGEQQSSQNWGFARQQGRNAAELPMMQLANKMWQELSDDLGVETSWVMGGNLAVFESEADETKYRQWVEVGRTAGIETRMLAASEISAVVPSWQREVRGGIFAPSDGHADPSTVVGAYVQACMRAGVRIMPHSPVLSLLTSGENVVAARTKDFTVSAPAVVVAAGAWSRKLLSTIRIDLPQNYIHGTVSLTSKAPPMTDVTVWGPKFSFRQRLDGKFVCATGGGGLVDIGLDVLAQSPLFMQAFRKNWKRFQIRPSRHIPQEIHALLTGKPAKMTGPPQARVDRRQPPLALRRLQQTLTGLDELEIESSWSGIIDSTPDGLPVLDSNTKIGGLTIATGFSGHGYGLVPAAGNIVADLVQGTTPQCDVSTLNLGRFSDGKYTSPGAIL